MDRDTQQGHSFGVLLVAGRRLVVLKASGELVGVLEYLVHSSRHLASLKESFPGAHRVDDHHCRVALDVTDFKDDGGRVRAEHHS